MGPPLKYEVSKKIDLPKFIYNLVNSDFFLNLDIVINYFRIIAYYSNKNNIHYNWVLSF